MSIPENMKEITDLASQLVNPILPQMEDFVTFDLAKKLKEKGFPIKTKTEGKFGLTKVKEVDILPTISQVLKWLRKYKNIHIEIRLFVVGYGFDILTIDKKNKLGWSGTKEFDTYEECAMYGIKYVLDSFI